MLSTIPEEVQNMGEISSQKEGEIEEVQGEKTTQIPNG